MIFWTREIEFLIEQNFLYQEIDFLLGTIFLFIAKKLYL